MINKWKNTNTHNKDGKTMITWNWQTSWKLIVLIWNELLSTHWEWGNNPCWYESTLASRDSRGIIPSDKQWQWRQIFSYKIITFNFLLKWILTPRGKIEIFLVTEILLFLKMYSIYEPWWRNKSDEIKLLCNRRKNLHRITLHI